MKLWPIKSNSSGVFVDDQYVVKSLLPLPSKLVKLTAIKPKSTSIAVLEVGSPRKRHEHNRAAYFLIVLMFLLIFVMLGGSGAYWLYAQITSPQAF